MERRTAEPVMEPEETILAAGEYALHDHIPLWKERENALNRLKVQGMVVLMKRSVFIQILQYHTYSGTSSAVSTPRKRRISPATTGLWMM